MRRFAVRLLTLAIFSMALVAAPALAAGPGKATQAPAAKAAQVKPKADGQVKPNALNANAKMGRHHVKHVRHHRLHKKMGAIKTHQSSKATIKPAAVTSRRG